MTRESLKLRIKELGRQTAEFSNQGVQLIKNGEREQGHALMRQAYETSKRCQTLIKELKRQEVNA